MLANYQDWSTNYTEPQPWRVADLSVNLNEDGELELYLVREGHRKNTFLIVLDAKTINVLEDKLKELLD